MAVSPRFLPATPVLPLPPSYSSNRPKYIFLTVNKVVQCDIIEHEWPRTIKHLKLSKIQSSQFFLKSTCFVVWMENTQKNKMIECFLKKIPQKEIFSVLWQAIPGPPVHPGHPVSPLPSSHDFSDRIGFFRELLVMATLSKVLFR